jgi:hypothetical protein
MPAACGYDGRQAERRVAASAARTGETPMPIAKVRGVNIFYQVIGDRGPWVALITGGRRGHDEFVPLATKLAQGGYRVVLHDRRTPAVQMF